MTGTTGLRHLGVECIVGIYPHERTTPQRVVLDLEFDYDFAPAAASDAIGDVIDYDGVTSAVTALLQTRGFQLIETMADAVATLLLEGDARVQTVRVRIEKPAAVPAAACSFVRVERHR
jgi:dihydroneopterin aldolase